MLCIFGFIPSAPTCSLTLHPSIHELSKQHYIIEYVMNNTVTYSKQTFTKPSTSAGSKWMNLKPHHTELDPSIGSPPPMPPPSVSAGVGVAPPIQKPNAMRTNASTVLPAPSIPKATSQVNPSRSKLELRLRLLFQGLLGGLVVYFLWALYL